MSSDWTIKSTTRLVRTTHGAVENKREWTSTENLQWEPAPESDPDEAPPPTSWGGHPTRRSAESTQSGWLWSWPHYPDPAPVLGLSDDPKWTATNECFARNAFDIHAPSAIFHLAGEAMAHPHDTTATAEINCELIINRPVIKRVGASLFDGFGLAELTGPGLKFSITQGSFHEIRELATGDYTARLLLQANSSTPLLTHERLLPGIRFGKQIGSLWIT